MTSTNPPSLTRQRVSANCYAILNQPNRLCDANSGFIANPKGSLVVDTQCDLAHARRLIALVGEIDPKPIRYVVNTHEDADHVWGNQLFDQAQIIAHRSVPKRIFEVADPKSIRHLVNSVNRWLIGSVLKRWHPGLFAAGQQLREDYSFDGVHLVPPDTLFDDRFELDLGGLDVHLIYVGPCHQVGDVLVHVPSERVLFAGDIMFTQCTPIGWAGTHENWITALRLIEDLAPEVIVPGHGPVCGLEGVQQMRAFLENVWQQAKQCYDHDMTAIEAAKAMDLGGFEQWHCPARVYMSVERAYREFRGKPFDWPWNVIKAFDAIYEVAKARGMDTSF